MANLSLEYTSDSKLTLPGSRRIRRHLALLGGTTSLGDCLVATRYLATPRQLVKGPTIVEYEQTFANYVGVRYGYSFSGGRVGLYGLLKALGVGHGDEVLLQAPTHIVVPNAIRYVGARPVYVDCRLDSYNMDLEQAEKRITTRTKVLLLRHTFGIPADLDAAIALAQKHGLELIEDCVHALGATYDGRQVGSFGRAAFFSTEETKTISSTMGGMVVTDDPEVAARLQAFQSECTWPPTTLVIRYMLKLILYYVLTEPHVHRYARMLYELLGRRHPLPRPTTEEELRGVRPAQYEQRLSNVQAVLALRQLRRLESNLAHRRVAASAYARKLSEAGFSTPTLPIKSEPALVRYPVWVEDRPTVVRKLAQYLVPGTWFTSVLEEATSPAYGNYQSGSCPRAEAAAEHLINLPTHPRVGLQDIDTITAALANAASAGPGGNADRLLNGNGSLTM